MYACLIIFAVDQVSVAAFYRFVSLPNFADLRAPLLAAGHELELRGSVLLASEGVNGMASGSRSALEAFLEKLGKLGHCPPLDPKWSTCDRHPFARWKVRLKKEIVAMKAVEVDLTSYIGTYATAAEWNALLDDPGVTVVDVRNSFEVEFGTFPGSVDPGTRGFREFASFAHEQLPDKSQPIAMFCTGGIRCEKAAAYLAAKGYTDITQLKDGILGYLEHVEQAENRWRGSCFVFDERIALNADLKPAEPEP